MGWACCSVYSESTMNLRGIERSQLLSNGQTIEKSRIATLELKLNSEYTFVVKCPLTLPALPAKEQYLIYVTWIYATEVVSHGYS